MRRLCLLIHVHQVVSLVVKIERLSGVCWGLANNWANFKKSRMWFMSPIGEDHCANHAASCWQQSGIQLLRQEWEFWQDHQIEQDKQSIPFDLTSRQLSICQGAPQQGSLKCIKLHGKAAIQDSSPTSVPYSMYIWEQTFVCEICLQFANLMLHNTRPPDLKIVIHDAWRKNLPKWLSITSLWMVIAICKVASPNKTSMPYSKPLPFLTLNFEAAPLHLTRAYVWTGNWVCLTSSTLQSFLAENLSNHHFETISGRTIRTGIVALKTCSCRMQCTCTGARTC